MTFECPSVLLIWTTISPIPCCERLIQYLPAGSFLPATEKSNGMFAVNLYCRDCAFADTLAAITIIAANKPAFATLRATTFFITTLLFNSHQVFESLLIYIPITRLGYSPPGPT